MATPTKYAIGVGLVKRQAYMFGGRFFVQCKEPQCTSMQLETDIQWCDRHVRSSGAEAKADGVPLCAICMEDVDRQSIEMCGHGHWFHVDCVANMNRMQCPYCRRPPTTETRETVLKKKTERLIEKLNRLPVYVREAFLEHAEELVEACLD